MMKTASATTPFRWLTVGLLLLMSSSWCSAEILDFVSEPQGGESFTASPFRLWYDPATPTIRGVYFWINHHGKESRDIAAGDVAIQAACAEKGFALMGAKLWDANMGSGIGNGVLRALDAFADMSDDHPELAQAPLFLEGYSWSGQWAYHFTKWKPSRVVGFITMKGGYHNKNKAGAAIEVPGALIYGSKDDAAQKQNMIDLFNKWRPQGARWALYVHQGSGHGRIYDRNFLDPIFHDIVDQRLSPNGQLQVIPEDDAWLGSLDSFAIGPYHCYVADRNYAPWLVSARVAADWQSLGTKGQVTDVLPCDGSTTPEPTPGPTPAPTPGPSPGPTPGPVPSGSMVKLVVVYDDIPEDTQWRLFQLHVDGSRTLLFAREYDNSDTTPFDQEFFVEPGSYDFRITDRASNGICCDDGNGSYQLFVDGDLLYEGGDFTRRKILPFTVG